MITGSSNLADFVAKEAQERAVTGVSASDNYGLVWRRNGLYIGLCGKTGTVVIAEGLGLKSVYPRRLANIAVEVGVDVHITEEGSRRALRSAVVVKCTSDSPDIHTLFAEIAFRHLSSIPPTTSNAEELLGFIFHLTELFRPLSGPPGSAVGLWGELAVILNSACPREAVSLWHTDKSARFDFQSASSVVEVKTTTGVQRHHKFSLPQMHPPQGIDGIVVSVLATEDPDGDSIVELRRKILEHLSSDPGLVASFDAVCIGTLGRAWASDAQKRFDFTGGLAAIRPYILDDSFPRLPVTTPGILSALADVDLEGHGTRWVPTGADPLLDLMVPFVG